MNPIMQMLGNNMGNPLQMIMQLKQSGGNPQAIINQMINQNPQLAPVWNQVQDMARGKTPEQLQQMVMGQAQKKGINPNDINSIFGR